MTKDPYTAREIDLLHDGIHEKLDEIIKKVDYTNGKVKRIIIALIAVASFSIGLGIVEAQTIVSLFL